MTLTQLSSIGGRLRQARLSQGRSIEEIAAGFNVNRSFIDQIEQGIVPALPEPYVRGIIAMYARKVGVNLEEIPGPASTDRGESGPAPVHPEAGTPRRERPAGDGLFADDPEPEKVRDRQRTIIAGLAILTVVGLGISVFWMSRENGSKPVQEISFSDAVKEQEAKYEARVRRSDSAAGSRDAAVQLARGDSLMLEGRTTDSVLVTIAIDHTMPRKFILPPRTSTQWKAEKSFLVTPGNPASLELTLNGIRLSSLVRPGKPSRSLFLTRSTLEKLQGKND